MNRSISIPANEAGRVRLFALSMDSHEAHVLKANDPTPEGFRPQELALGSDAIDELHVEVFAVSDLGEMTLPAYLIDGAGVEAAALEPHRVKLGALDGWIMLVYSSAFKGMDQTISPDTALTLIGTYPQEGVDWQETVDLSTPSARPQPVEPPAPLIRKKPSDAAMSGRIAMVALLVAFAVVGLMVWVGS